jgi:hypothetical protein
MLSPTTRRQLPARAALLSMLLLAACATGSVRVVKPEPARLAEVAPPAIPEPTVACAHDPAELCLTDRATAEVIVAYDEALAEANRRLRWLATFFAELPE